MARIITVTFVKQNFDLNFICRDAPFDICFLCLICQTAAAATPPYFNA